MPSNSLAYIDDLFPFACFPHLCVLSSFFCHTSLALDCVLVQLFNKLVRWLPRFSDPKPKKLRVELAP